MPPHASVLSGVHVDLRHVLFFVLGLKLLGDGISILTS
jgi:hypothetical protein